MPADPSDLKRNEAARWIRHTLGVVGGRDLPADPSEDDFRIALRSGILLCNVLNKVKPGAVPKVCLSHLFTLYYCAYVFSSILLYAFYLENIFSILKTFERPLGLPV